MLLEWQGILQFISQSGVSCDSFFSVNVHCCSMTMLKISEFTNVGQSHRLTHCLKNLRRYNLKSLIFKHDLSTVYFSYIPSKILQTFCEPFLYGVKSVNYDINCALFREVQTCGHILGIPLFFKLE